MGLYSWLRISAKDDGDWLAVNDRSRRHLATAREAGLKGTLYLGASGLIGNVTKPEELAALKKRIVRANGDGTVTALLPKGRLIVYTLVRFGK